MPGLDQAPHPATASSRQLPRHASNDVDRSWRTLPAPLTLTTFICCPSFRSSCREARQKELTFLLKLKRTSTFYLTFLSHSCQISTSSLVAKDSTTFGPAAIAVQAHTPHIMGDQGKLFFHKPHTTFATDTDNYINSFSLCSSEPALPLRRRWEIVVSK